MKRTNTRFLRFPVVVLLLFAMAFVSFAKPNAAVKKYDRKTTNAQHILTGSYAEFYKCWVDPFGYVTAVGHCE